MYHASITVIGKDSKRFMLCTYNMLYANHTEAE